MTQTKALRPVSRKSARSTRGQPGALDRFDDGSWEFEGNNEGSAEDVADSIIEYEKKEGNQDYQGLRAPALAKMLLDDPHNAQVRHAVGGNVKAPIPKGQQFVAESMSLKQIVGMLMAHETQLRQALTQPQETNKDASKTLIGDVRGGGLALPYEPD